MASRTFTCEEIAEKLGNGKEVKTGPDSYNTLCPVHGDSTPSLTISQGKNGKILVHCHAGCNQDDIIQVLRDLDLWPKKTKIWTAKPHAPKGTEVPKNLNHYRLGKPVASWVYRNRAGHVAAVISRFIMLSKDGKPVLDEDGKPKKEIIPLSWCYSDDGEIGWHWKQMPEPRCLYNEHRLDEPKIILVVEGEKSADAGLQLFPELLTISWPGGSKAVSRANWEALKGRDIIIWPDNDKPGAKAAEAIAETLLKIGVRSIKRVELPEELPEGWDIADVPPVGVDLKQILQRAQNYEPVGDSVVEKYNQRFALVMIGGQAVVLHEEGYTPEGLAQLGYLSVAGFKEYYGNRMVTTGRSQVPESVYWLKHEERRSYNKIVFEPEQEIKGAYNMWKGFSVEADPTGDWSLLDEHIRQNLARGDESLYKWIMAWFAQIIQQPSTKVGTSLAIRGKQGTGKTIIGKAMGALYRPHYVLVEDPRYIIGNFNAHMATTMLLHCDESFFAGDPRNVGKLKGLVTSDTHRIELKGKDSFEVKNYMRLLITSNHDFVVPAALEERRFAVIDAGEERMQDRVFFKAVWKQLQNGGFGGLLHHLQQFDMSTIDIGQIPRTAALQDQKLYSLDGVARFWYERLSFGQISIRGTGTDWPTTVPIEQVYQDYIRRSEEWGDRRRVDSCTFGKEIKKYWPGKVVEKKRMSVEKFDDTGRKVKEMSWAYILKSLKAHRDSFSMAIGQSRWNDLDNSVQDTTGKPEIPAVQQTLDDNEAPF